MTQSLTSSPICRRSRSLAESSRPPSVVVAVSCLSCHYRDCSRLCCVAETEAKRLIKLLKGEESFKTVISMMFARFSVKSTALVDNDLGRGIFADSRGKVSWMLVREERRKLTGIVRRDVRDTFSI